MFRPTLRVLLMLISALPFAAISASHDPANDQTRRLIRQVMLEQRIPGLQIAVVKQGQIVLSEAYGLANVENGVPATRDTRFPLNSATKAFTGVAAAGTAGQLDLDARRAWMIFHLRGKTYACASCWRIPQAFRTSSMRTDCLAVVPRQAWAAVTARPVEAAPGSVLPNQTNYVLLARIIAIRHALRALPGHRPVQQCTHGAHHLRRQL